MAHPIRRSLLALLVPVLLGVMSITVAPEAVAQDVNECEVNNGGCATPPNGRCTDTPESFICSCNSGYTGNGIVCPDINECATNAGGCGSGFTCSNQPGTFNCNDINECATSNGGCAFPPNGRCTNMVGSRTCSCNTGYGGNGIICTDINECATNNGGCSTSPSVLCTNTDGAHSCGACPGGYTGDGVTCADVNECATSNGGCAASPAGACSNTVGSRDCVCNSGYSGNGFTCFDINECATSNGGCSTSPVVTCTNTAGTRSCGACPSGYAGNGVTCADVNECGVDNGGCAAEPAGVCTNTVGSRDCACGGGYTGNGITCPDINECATNNAGCGGGYTCNNQPGTFGCADINECANDGGGCGNGFACSNAPGTRECLDINECETNGLCNVGACTNDEGTFTCACPAGVTGTTCDVNGYVPPDKATATCAKAVSDNIVKYVKCLTKCRTQKAGKALGGKNYDEQACASGPKSCRSAYDKKMLTLVQNGTCPTCLDQAAQTGLADDALTAILSSKGAAYCAGSEPLQP